MVIGHFLDLRCTGVFMFAWPGYRKLAVGTRHGGTEQKRVAGVFAAPGQSVAKLTL